jgi:O-antigen/teichoic acid export membrane protein
MYCPFLFYCYKTVPLSVIPRFSFARGKSLFRYGGWVSVSGMATPIVETFDRFLLGAIVGAQAVSHYTIAYQLATKIRIIPASLTRALFPRLSSNSLDPSNLVEKSVRKFLPIMTAIIVAAMFLTQPFLDFWLKNEAALNIAPICVIFLIGVWANSLAYLPYSFLHASGKPKLVAVIHLAELLPFILTLYLLTLSFGVIGAVTAWTLRATFDAVLLYIAARNIKNIFIHLAFPFLIVLFSSLSMIEYVGKPLSFWLKVASIFGLMTWLIVNAAITSPNVIQRIRNFGQKICSFLR